MKMQKTLLIAIAIVSLLGFYSSSNAVTLLNGEARTVIGFGFSSGDMWVKFKEGGGEAGSFQGYFFSPTIYTGDKAKQLESLILQSINMGTPVFLVYTNSQGHIINFFYSL